MSDDPACTNDRGTQTEVVALYVPCGSEEEAARLAGTLLSERLIACGNIYPSRSLYLWNGKLTDEREYLLLCKTAKSRVESAERRIAELHSYDIPCIARLHLERVNRSYEAWVLEQLTAQLPLQSSEKKESARSNTAPD